jgi:biotin carboxylase
MRLLVTNTRTAQAYAVIRALRPHAEIIVATIAGPRPLGIWPTCSAAYSRLVDRRYRVPDPELDWHEGRVGPENTERERVFIDAILEVCRRERIDTIFPSDDAWVYVFFKNKQLLEQHGILVPVPDLDTVIKPLDKYRTIRCAEEVGFPTPRTYLPAHDADVADIARQLQPPWVIKPRFTSGGRGLAIVETVEELHRRTQEIQRKHSMPIIQEYIPGRGAQVFHLVLDRAGRAWSVFTPTAVRMEGRVFRNSPGAFVSAPPHPLLERVVGVVNHMGWWGGATIQTKRDARDGQLKLMEINPRLGTTLWHRTELGINSPLLCLKIARNEPYEPAGDFPLGCLLLDPIEDPVNLFVGLLDLAAYRVRSAIGRTPSIDPLSTPHTLKQILSAYRAQYFGNTERRYSTHFRYALSDPLPALIWTSKVLGKHSVSKMRGLGR